MISAARTSFDLGVRIEQNVLLDMKPDLSSSPSPQYEQATWYGRDGKARLFQRVGHDTTPESRFVVEEYRYDALGRRVMLRSQTRATCTAAFCRAALERFIWDGDQLLYEIRIKGDSGRTNAQLDVDTVTADSSYGRIGYVHGLGIDAPLALDRNGVLIVPHENWRGFYDSGADSTGSAFVTAINWIGREQDPFMDSKLPRDSVAWSGSLLRAQQDQSGLMYRRHRYYDPGTGRFTQVDPIGLRGGVNLYGYANGDPINLSDPFGLWPDWVKKLGRTVLKLATAVVIGHDSGDGGDNNYRRRKDNERPPISQTDNKLHDDYVVEFELLMSMLLMELVNASMDVSKTVWEWLTTCGCGGQP